MIQYSCWLECSRQATLRNANHLQAANYIEGGATAISVLTEPSHFGGDLAHLEEVSAIAEQARVPVMRKDFLVDTLQVLEARKAGASGVLLIAAISLSCSHRLIIRQ